MFKFDQSTLPRLTSRKALVVVDFQRDFLSSEGALPVTEPAGFIERTLRLVGIFRFVGPIIWVQSESVESQTSYADQIIAADTSGTGQHAVSEHSTDREAFLSREDNDCVMRGTLGCEPPSIVRRAIQESDLVVRKTNYSSFVDTPLLRLLRTNMIMEVLLCGSLANIGVYATAMDAAGHGLSITIISDCCGYRSESRQLRSFQTLTNLTGCDVVLSQAIIDNVHVDAKTEEATERKFDVPSDLSPKILQSMNDLRLSHDPSPPLNPSILYSSHEISEQQENPRASPDVFAAKGPLPAASLASPLPHPTSQRRTIDQSIIDTAEVNTADTTSELAPHQKAETLEIPRLSARESSPDVSHASAQPSENGLCEGDTNVIENLLSPTVEIGVFEKLKDEVQWEHMSHQGGEVPRLVAVQGNILADGSLPIYRHPSDESPPLLPFSPTVLAIKSETEKHLGHSLNHVLIQYYRDGNDYISEHSDKTLDIVPGSFIANVSLGAQRNMVLRTKRVAKESDAVSSLETRTRRTIRARLPHNSLLKMGLETNMKWLHSIRQDKRDSRDKSPAELAYGGRRISLTFRQIGTFLNRDQTLIWGQGATGKTRDIAQSVVNGQGPEAVKMLRAFGNENHSTNFNWSEIYGEGFNVLHLRSCPRLFLSNDRLINMSITLMLTEYSIKYAKGNIMAPKSTSTGHMAFMDPNLQSNSLIVKYQDNDVAKSEVRGDIAIMLYLHSRCMDSKCQPLTADLARNFTLFQQALAFRDIARQSLLPLNKSRCRGQMNAQLQLWDKVVQDKTFISGQRPGLPDFLFWPSLHYTVEQLGTNILEELENLRNYYELMQKCDTS